MLAVPRALVRLVKRPSITTTVGNPASGATGNDASILSFMRKCPLESISVFGVRAPAASGLAGETALPCHIRPWYGHVPNRVSCTNQMRRFLLTSREKTVVPPAASGSYALGVTR